MKLYIIFFSFIFILAGCDKDNENPGLNENFSTRGLFIVNEGNLGFGNASLSYYEPDSMKLSNNLFLKTNNFPVGDALQSLAIKDKLGFLTVSNSGKIIIFNVLNFNHIATIGGFTAPRYIEFLPGNSAVVSDLYNKSLKVIDLEDYKLKSEINLGRSSEQMIIHDNYLYVTSWSFSNRLYKIDISNLEVVDSLETGFQPNSLALDAANHLWVLCDGGYPGNPQGHEAASLLRVDLAGFLVTSRLVFPEERSSPSELQTGPGGENLYFIDSGAGTIEAEKGVFRMGISDTELPQSAFIPEDGKLYYGLAIDPLNGEIYCSDARDYLSKGRVYRYTPEGVLLDNFQAGIIPGSFAFTY